MCDAPLIATYTGSETARSYPGAARTGNTSLVHAGQVGWVLGFVTGAGWSSLETALATDSRAIEKWVDNYCQENPLEVVSDASARLVVELRAKG